MEIKNKIYTIRGKQVMLDNDLAYLYGVTTKRLNEQVKRNTERFPEDFMFQLSKKEKEEVVANCDHLKNLKFSYTFPRAFTEEGVANLSAVLRSERAIEVNVQIMRAFVAMRRIISQNQMYEKKFQQIDQKLIEHDKNFDKVFNAIERKDIKPDKGIFFDGQIFDAHKFVSDLINSAKNKIILVDNYVDYSVLSLFSNTGLDVTIYTKNFTRKLRLDLEKYNSQYKPIKIKEFKSSHDRFLIVDDKEVYHLGASIKDLGKKWFGFSKFGKEAINILEKLK